MRSYLGIALFLTVTAASTLGAQQVVSPRLQQQPVAELATDANRATARDARLVQRPLRVEAREASGAAAVAREVSARTALAIVGAVVVVGALIALLL